MRYPRPLLPIVAVIATAAFAETDPFREKAFEIVADVGNGDATAYMEATDWEGLVLPRVDEFIGVNPDHMTERERLLRDRMLNKFRSDMQRNIEQNYKDAVQVAVPYLVHKEDGARAIVRLYYEDHSLVYWRFDLAREADGRIVIREDFDYGVGLTFREQIDQSFALLRPESSWVSQLFPHLADSGQSEHLELTVSAFRALRSQNYAAFVTQYLQFPEELQRKRMMVVAGLGASSLLEEDEPFYQVIALVQRYYPDDPWAAMYLELYYEIEEDYDLAIQYAKKVNQYLGYEDAGRIDRLATLYFYRQDYDKALELAEKAKLLEPDFPGSYWTLLDLHMELYDFEKTVHYVDELNNRFDVGFVPADFRDDGFYAEFVISKEFAQWAETHDARNALPRPSGDE